MARITPAEAGPPPRPREDFGPKTRAHTRYHAADGKQIPGVTGVVKLVDDQSDLVEWANDLGLQGIDSQKHRDESAEIGTLAHHLIRREIDGLVPDLDDFTPHQLERARYSLARFKEWRRQHHLEPVYVERKLISQVHRFGGTIDLYCLLDGVPTLVDFKSGNIRFGHRVQVSAYWWLLAELGYPVKGVRILGVGRSENEELHEAVFTGSQVLAGWEIFRRAREIYDLRKQLVAA